MHFTAAAAQVTVYGNTFGGENATNTTGIAFLYSGSVTGSGVISNNEFVELLNSITVTNSQFMMIIGNMFYAPITGGITLGSNTIAYGNSPEASYTIATLPACSGNLLGVNLFIINGATSATYHGAVSTTGATWSRVLCASTGWVYD